MQLISAFPYIDIPRVSLYLVRKISSFFMNILKPSRLDKGDLIAIVAPGSPPKSQERVSKGIRYLEQLGYRVVVGKHADDRYGYLAGTDKARAGDLNGMFSDRRIKAIFCIRGGYGAHRILPLLDYTTIRRNPKIFVGYSDITALQLGIYSLTGLVTFSGPMVATEFGGKFDGGAEEHFWRCLASTHPLGVIRNSSKKFMKTLCRGSVAGRLLGGNLSLVTALLGTPYLPHVRRSILALEEIEEPPYKIDRMLNHLKLAGAFSRGNGVLLGRFIDCHPTSRRNRSLTLNQVFHDVVASAGVPAVAGLHYGHVKGSLTLPLGIMTRLNASATTLEFLEPAVQ